MTDFKNIYGEVIFTSASTNHTVIQAVHRALRTNVNLQYADLKGVDLAGADLGGANFQGVNLCGADLQNANLRCVSLRGADLRGAELCSAKFYGKGGTTKIKKNQVDDFFKALGITIE